jgi:membrane protein YdbS with pleckstrin-like domain
MLQRDPLKQSINRRMGWYFIVFPIFILFYFVIELYQYITFTGPHRELGLVPLFIFPICIICFVFAWLIFRRTWRLRAQKRALALQGDQSLLASEQPTPDPNALALPATIELRMRPTLYYIALAYVLIVTITAALIVFFVVPFSSQEKLIFVLGAVGFIVLLIVAIFIASYFGMRLNSQSITVTDEGITTRYLNKTTTIPWHEARFFSINGIAKQDRAVIYELSSDTTSALWTRLLVSKGIVRTATLRPTMPFSEYEQKSQALINLIAARTNLPLYDLRDTTNKWYT